MKIVGGRKFSLNKRDRPMVIRRQKPRSIPLTAYALKTHWMYGSLGAASPVRRIDPATGNVIEILPPND
jgi:hypothetical protein